MVSSSGSVNTITTKMSRSHPIPTHRSSPYSFLRSRNVTKGFPKTVETSLKSIPCFCRLTAFFPSSHVNFIDNTVYTLRIYVNSLFDRPSSCFYPTCTFTRGAGSDVA